MKLSKYSIWVALILMLVCFAFYKPIGLLFSKDPTVLELFYNVFWIVLLMQPINAIAFVFDGIFKGLAEVVTLRNLLLISTFLGFWPAIVISDKFDLKLYGIWIAFTVWMLMRSGVLVYIFKRRYLAKNM